MGACNKSDGYQYSKNKGKFDALAKANSWVTQKAKRAKLHINRMLKRQEKAANMSVKRGTARAIRREGIPPGLLGIAL